MSRKDSFNPEEKTQDIGDYNISKTIGEGTFGKVKLGYHKLAGEKVAIKVLEKNRIVDVADIERVSREIHILKLIRHPNIIQLYEIIETPSKLYLIMEYASSGELFDYIVSQTRIKEQEACKFYQQLIAGIEYIHKLNVVHRDLKPENLLLDHNNDIKIVDFGLSNTYSKNEMLKTACGSPCYAAPEMIAGKDYTALKVDIWSSGIILFAMICGYLPFEDPKTRKLYKKIMKGAYSTPNYISESAKDLLKGILRTDPETRFTLDDIKNHAWFNQIKQEISPGILVGYDKIKVDNAILNQLKSSYTDTEYARKCIEANKHNSISTAYYLLLKKHLRDGGTSIAGYSKSLESEGQRFSSTSRGYSLNISQETIPLYRLSHDKIFTPTSKRLFEYTISPKTKTHDRNISVIVERNPSPRVTESKRSTGQSLVTPRPPSRELFKFTRMKKEERNNVEKQKETFLKRRNANFRNSLDGEKALLQPIKFRRA